MSKFLHNNETRAMTVTWSLLQNETAKMAVDHSPEILRGPWQFFFFWGVGGGVSEKKNFEEFLMSV